jgi:hypothetical protein
VAEELLVCAVADDLIRNTLTDRGEIWAVWKSYAGALGLEPAANAPSFEPLHISALESSAGPALREVLASYRAANRALARELTALWNAGELSQGLRSVLGSVVLFHLHRYGFDAAGHARVAYAMLRALDPTG